MLADSKESKWVHSLYAKYIKAEEKEGNEVKRVKRHNFDGVASKHLFKGNGGKFDFFEAKGAATDELANKVREMDVPVKATRTDWSVTFPNKEDSATYANSLRQFVQGQLMVDRTPHPGRTALWESENHGNTYYIMTGDKSVMHRTYNKAVESPGEYPSDAWRHELQLKGVRAARSFEEFRGSQGSDFLSRAYVAGFLMQYGIYEDWMNDVEPCRHPSKRRKSDRDKKLQWFETTACLVVEKLLALDVSHGALIHLLRKAGLNCVEEK